MGRRNSFGSLRSVVERMTPHAWTVQRQTIGTDEGAREHQFISRRAGGRFVKMKDKCKETYPTMGAVAERKARCTCTRAVFHRLLREQEIPARPSGLKARVA